MKTSEQLRFDKLYKKHLRALKLQGYSVKTIDVYSRPLRRLSLRYDRVPDKITHNQLANFFSELIDSHSWSTVRTDRRGLQFFWEHILKKDWRWVNMVKPPKVQSIPDIFSIAEVHQLLHSTKLLRYRTFILCTYLMGLRLSETLNLHIQDIDSANHRLHVRRGKGHKDRFVPLPYTALQQLRLLWSRHRHPHLLFPSTKSIPSIQHASSPMSHGTTQYAFKNIVRECGIKKKFQFIPFDTATPLI